MVSTEPMTAALGHSRRLKWDAWTFIDAGLCPLRTCDGRIVTTGSAMPAWSETQTWGHHLAGGAQQLVSRIEVPDHAPAWRSSLESSGVSSGQNAVCKTTPAPDGGVSTLLSE